MIYSFKQMKTLKFFDLINLLLIFILKLSRQQLLIFPFGHNFN